MVNSIINQLEELRTLNPLVHNITNLVVMNNTANALLALGASPVMAHSPAEIEDVVALSRSLVINIGTLSTSWIESMFKAASHASTIGCPWVLDPVGAGISVLRNEALKQLLSLRPTVIRGNASEILALADFSQATTKGVDSTAHSSSALHAAIKLQDSYKSIICISGEIDYIISANEIIEVHNGHIMMTKVTGLGCTSSALIGAFLGLRNDTVEETIAGVAVLSLAGELAARTAKGPGSLQMHLLDALYNLDTTTLQRELNIQRYARRD
ncbi:MULTISPECIES: hydroxyethylthiazole kinase [Sphingobacterium]|uniref:hydroxyethylthiazole kinase n=1 Tax=Sphingobacterium TaxID=28453 RepID=UPI0013DB03BB|nr:MULTISPECIES: hydroxyethylthiazole kinase [unclassified Sphingobacterium]